MIGDRDTRLKVIQGNVRVYHVEFSAVGIRGSLTNNERAGFRNMIHLDHESNAEQNSSSSRP